MCTVVASAQITAFSLAKQVRASLCFLCRLSCANQLDQRGSKVANAPTVFCRPQYSLAANHGRIGSKAASHNRRTLHCQSPSLLKGKNPFGVFGPGIGLSTLALARLSTPWTFSWHRSVTSPGPSQGEKGYWGAQGWNFGRFLVLLGFRRLYSLSGKYSPSIPFPTEPEIPGTQSTRLRPQFHTESLIGKPKILKRQTHGITTKAYRSV